MYYRNQSHKEVKSMHKPALQNSKMPVVLRKNGDIDDVDLAKMNEELDSLSKTVTMIDDEITRLEKSDRVPKSEIQKIRQNLKNVSKSLKDLKISDSLGQNAVMSDQETKKSHKDIDFDILIEVSPITITTDYSAVDKKLREESKKAIAYLDSL